MGSDNNSPSPLNNNQQPAQPPAPSPLIGNPSLTSHSSNNENLTPPLHQSQENHHYALCSPFYEEIAAAQMGCARQQQQPYQPTEPSYFDKHRHMMLGRYSAPPEIRNIYLGALNCPAGDGPITHSYPIQPIHRSPSFLQRPLMPQQQMPPPKPIEQSAPAPPAKKKRLNKKEKEEQKKKEEQERQYKEMMRIQQQQQHQMMNGMQPMFMAPQMPMHPMDRPSSSGNGMPDQRRISPNAIPPHMKGKLICLKVQSLVQ